jgi:hypothetical protein
VLVTPVVKLGTLIVVMLLYLTVFVVRVVLVVVVGL